MFKLIIEDDEGHTTVVPLVKDEITIGRKEGNTIRLTERNVSRHHARLIRSNGSVFIEDLDSYNGVKVNGDRISARTTIREGDLVEIGDYHFAIHWVVQGDSTDIPPLQKVETPPPLAQAAQRFSAAQGVAGTAVMRLPAEEKKPADSAAVRPWAIPENEAGRLVVVSTDMAGASFPLVRSEMVVGRADECDIVLPHRSVSSRHAKFVCDGGVYRVIDLDSANGVLVNGEEYARVDVRKGDTIELGHVRLRYVAPGESYQFEPEGAAAVQHRPFLDAAAVESRAAKKTSGMKRFVWIAGTTALIGAIGFGVYRLTHRPESPPEKPGMKLSIGEPSMKPDARGIDSTEPGKERGAAAYAKGLDLFKARDFGGAVKAFEVSLQTNPDQAGAKEMKEKAQKEQANVTRLENTRQAVRDRDWDTAWDELNQISADSVVSVEVATLKPEVNAQYKRYHLNLASKLKDQGRLEESKKHVESVLLIDENNQLAMNLMKGLDGLLAAKRLPPVAAVTERKQPEKVVVKKDIEPIVDRKKEVRELVAAGLKAYNEKRTKEAVVILSRALKIEPSNCMAIKLLGATYAKEGNIEKGFGYYERFVQVCPTDPNVPQVRVFLKDYLKTKTDNP